MQLLFEELTSEEMEEFCNSFNSFNSQNKVAGYSRIIIWWRCQDNEDAKSATIEEPLFCRVQKGIHKSKLYPMIGLNEKTHQLQNAFLNLEQDLITHKYQVYKEEILSDFFKEKGETCRPTKIWISPTRYTYRLDFICDKEWYTKWN